MSTKITKEVLEEHGFKHVGDDLGKPIFRKEPGHGYYFHIEYRLGNYPETNPNCGIVSIYSPEDWASAVPPDLIRKEDWTKEDMKRASEYKVKMEAHRQPIAWHVHSLERLQTIYESLTQQKLEKIIQE